jgi:hypothetical protein
MNSLSPTDLIRDRYGSNAFNPEHLWNETLATLLSHRSVRAYLPDALPSQTLETLISAAQAAATVQRGDARVLRVSADECCWRMGGAFPQASRNSTGIEWARSVERTFTSTWISAAVMTFF